MRPGPAHPTAALLPAIMAAALPHRAARPLACTQRSPQPHTGGPWALPGLKSGNGEGTVQCCLKLGQIWSTQRVKCHQKSVGCLRAHWEPQPLPSKQPDVSASQRQGHTSHWFYAFVTRFYMLKIKILNTKRSFVTYIHCLYIFWCLTTDEKLLRGQARIWAKWCDDSNGGIAWGRRARTMAPVQQSTNNHCL